MVDNCFEPQVRKMYFWDRLDAWGLLFALPNRLSFSLDFLCFTSYEYLPVFFFFFLSYIFLQVGSFLMGWCGVVFKGDISQVSDILAIGLTTGYLGSLTTLSGWDQKMLDLSVNGHWVQAVLGFLTGNVLHVAYE